MSSLVKCLFVNALTGSTENGQTLGIRVGWWVPRPGEGRENGRLLIDLHKVSTRED